MTHDFLLPEYNAIMEKSKTGAARPGGEYTKILDHDGTEFYVDCFPVACPDFGIGVQNGYAHDTVYGGDSGHDTAICLTYDLEAGLPDGIIEVYSNTSIPYLLSTMASACGMDENTLRCRLTVPEE